MESIGKSGVAIHSSEKVIIWQVMKCCDQEVLEKSLLITLVKAHEQAAKYLLCFINKAATELICKLAYKYPLIH